jgi:DNA-binding CsgD family transcriptional regulator
MANQNLIEFSNGSSRQYSILDRRLEPVQPEIVQPLARIFNEAYLKRSAQYPKVMTEAWAGELLNKLAALPATSRRPLVAITENPCPEYSADLWDLKPGVLLINPRLHMQVEHALEIVALGERYRTPDVFGSILMPSERVLLRYLPVGLSNKRIAKQLVLSERTVRNRLVDIAEKLRLENRTQIAMYYTGQWHWLERYRDRFEDFRAHRTPVFR